MSVSQYTLERRYNLSRLKNVLYLVSADHVKDVHVDNGEAYIEDLSQLPLRISGFNIQYTEETSLDERYKFEKKITLSMKGYVNYKSFEGKYYAIVEDYDGIFYMVNVDFPSKITHTFNLSNNTNQTDFTFQSSSNFPTIKLNSYFAPESVPCIGYNVYGIDKLKLIDKDYARLDVENKKTKLTGSWSNIEFLGKSCSFQEVYDGEKVTSTITFDIPLNHKIGWTWNLLEFLDNLYAATIIPKGGNDVYYSGFNFGLQPSYTIKSSSNAGESDIITVTLVETSNYGSTAASGYTEQSYDTTSWRYIKWLGDIQCFECVGYSTARYLVQQEIDAFGNPTGNYKVKNGYQSQFQMLHVTGTFSNDEQFNEVSCGGDNCKINTTIPDVIVFSSATCNTYTVSASCDWNITDLASYLTASPNSGNADQTYNVSICNTSTQISGQTSTFTLQAGNNVKIINVELLKDSFINPVTTAITCISQDVVFTFNPSCPVRVASIDSRLTYEIGNSTLKVNVPANLLATAAKTWTIEVRDCDNRTVFVKIIQDKVYEEWRDSGFYTCVGGNSYKQEVRYTGETPTNLHITTESRPGELIEEGDSRCNKRMTKWEWVGNYYCVNGNKQKCIEQFESYDNGITWTKTGLTQLGEIVEYDSDWCDLVPEYDWRLTEKWQCGDGTEYTFEYCDGRKFLMEDVPNSGGTYNYCITSIAGSEDVSFNVTRKCDWVTVTPGASSMTVTVEANTDPTSDRECVIYIHQQISGKQVALNVLQAAGAATCERLLDSCCGASMASGSRPDCDIELGRSGGAEYDGVLQDARVSLTSTQLPSWLEVENHDTYVVYRAVEDNTSTSNRYFTVTWEKVSGASTQCDTAETIVKQLGGAVPRPYVFRWENGLPYFEANVDANAGVVDKNVISTYNGSNTSYTASESCDWVGSYSATPTNFKIEYEANTATTSRSCTVYLTQDGSHADMSMTINQAAAGAPGETYIKWGDNLHPSEYSATTTWNGYVNLVPFYSLLNGVETNAVLSTDTNWIITYNQLYYNYNEVKPNRNETIYLNPNTSVSERSGWLTLTQKGGTDYIRVKITQGAYVADCTISSFSIPDTVCIGEPLEYSYTVNDARCDRTFYFNVFDASGNTFTSTSTPVNGRGSGTFSTTNMVAGTAQMSVVVGSSTVSKQIQVTSCGSVFQLIGSNSATTTWNGYISPVSFNSTVGDDNVNAVMSSNVSWIITNGSYYMNQNELRPGVNNTVYLERNTSVNPRTGTLTLTQKGTEKKLYITITQGAYVPDCKITSFAFTPGDVCRGSEQVEFDFTVADSACTTQQNFNLYDSAGTMFNVKVTPSNGSGSGAINTSGMALGTASMSVVVNGASRVFDKEIIDCGGGGTYWDTGLPVVVIDTPGRQPITSKTEWITDASIKIYKNINTIVYDNSALSIRGRGNSTWNDCPKKPYALKLENKTEILGMAKSKRWVLLANYADRILMRNEIANEISHCTDLSTGMGWAPHGEFVELVLNGTHIGNYYLSEQVRVESNRIDIDEFSDYLVEMDRYSDQEEYWFRSAMGYKFNVKSPEAPNVNYIKGKIDTFETALSGGSAYASLIDYNSFADYWIVEELCQNFEIGSSPGSVFCYYLEDSSDGTIKMGPPWDFDYSTFNLYWPLKAGDGCSGTTVPANGYMPEALRVCCKIYYDYLFNIRNDRQFKSVVKQRWNTIKPKLDAILSRFDYWYNKLYESEKLNWALWEIPSTFEPGQHPDYNMTFLDAKNSAKEFYRVRLNFLNGVINSF